MKRYVIATASALFLLAGTAATASVPHGPAFRSPHHYQFSPSAHGGPGVETVAPGRAPVDPGVVADPDVTAPGVPGSVAPLLGAVDPVLGAVDPALAALAGVVPPPVAGALSPVAAPAVPVPPPVPGPELSPGPEPPKESKAPAPARKPKAAIRQPGKAALQTAATAGDIFKGLPADGHAAYGTGSIIHTHVLQAGNQRLENTDIAFSGATFASAPISEIKNEVARIVAPALAAGNSFGRGSGLEVGLAIDQSGQNQIIPGEVAEAKAPPSTAVINTGFRDVNANPLVTAKLLRGEAQALANAICTPELDLTWGRGYAADVGLVGTPNSPVLSTAHPDPERSLSHSKSRTYLVAQDGAPSPIRKFGLASETRQTIAPVTLFKGVAGQELTLEFAGEWVLTTIADGKTGKVHYGPGNVTPNTPLLRILRPGQAVQEILSTQALFGPDGLTVDVSPVIKVVIGAPPRMIGGADNSKPVQTPTLAAAAVDVVKVQVLAATGGITAADIRIGHMESATASSGIECGIQMLKKTDKDLVGPGDTFTWTVTVTNPNDCVLTKLKVVDTITATPGVIWTVDSSTPKADQMTNSGLTWNDIGPLNPGQSKDLTIKVTVSPKSGGGKFLDEAVATGVCGPAAGTAGAEAAVGVPLEARVSLNLPEVSLALGANLLPRELPRTGGLLAVLQALALTGGGLLLRQSKRRKR